MKLFSNHSTALVARPSLSSLGRFKGLLSAAAMAVMPMVASAQNPVIQTLFSTDPAPLVVGDRMYLYTGHDEDNADFFWMQEWRVYSSTDMVNWTDHGVPLALETFSWADDRAWAAQTIERDGKFYWYICAHSKLSGGMAIGVAVAESPTGPFKDAIGRPLYDNGSWDHIDPTVMIDDDGQAWIYWGNPRIYCGKLNKDMVSFDGEVFNLELTEAGFGAPDPKDRKKDVKYKDMYTEGPWIMKCPQMADAKKAKKAKAAKNPKPGSTGYYLLYAAGGVPEHIAYSWAPSPTGPWTYMGTIMPEGGTSSFTNHCGYEHFKGHDYFFYHTGKLPRGGGFGRSVAIEEFKFNADGTFPTILPTDKGVDPIATLNPYSCVEAETMAFSFGVKSEPNALTGVYVSEIHNNDYIKLQAVDFGASGPKSFEARVACALQGGTIEVHADSIKGTKMAEVTVPHTGGWETWQTVSAAVSQKVTGVHDLFFVFRGRKGVKIANFDWWKFEN